MQQNNGIGKSQLIGFAALSFILMSMMFYFQSNEKLEEQVPYKAEKSNIIQMQNDTNAINIQKIQLKNKLLTIDFTTLGGQISTVKLNRFNVFNEKLKDKPVLLFANKNSDYGFQFKDKTGKIIDTKYLLFNATTKDSTITMQANIGSATIQFIYTLRDKYVVDFKVKTNGLSQIISDNTTEFVWDYSVREAEKGRSQEQTHTEFVYAFNNYNSYDYDSRGEMDETKETLNWIGVKQQFFSVVIESQNGFKNSKGNQEVIEKGEFLKKFKYNGQIDLISNDMDQNFKWYFMPLDLNLLKSYNKNFDKIIPFGWSFIGSLNRLFFIPLYNLLSSWGISAGWVIFFMTITVKIILSPIMYKQHKLSAMMRVIRPEIEEAQEKYKNSDPLKKQQAIMEVYRKAGVNQFAGCLPGLVQIPIFYALFRFFPNMLELRGKKFWFTNDLTAYDDLIKLPFNIPYLGEHLSIFALACIIVILIYTIMTTGNMQQPTQEGMPNMKPLMYIFPVTFLFFLNSAASGLSWYYFVSNAINIVIILVIKYFILDEKKIHAQIQENKSKPRKEGRFQSKMREIMKKAQEQQIQMEKLKQQQNKKK